MPTDSELSEIANQSVQNWLEAVVIGQSFCPFAGAPFRAGKVKIDAFIGTLEQILQQFSRLIAQMEQLDFPETLLFVLPKGYEDFFDFLDLQDLIQQLVDEHFDEDFSLASFHPHYQFAEYPATDIAHYIHRSPFPIIHILRESSIDAAVEAYPDIDAIPAKNREKARALGLEFFKKHIDS